MKYVDYELTPAGIRHDFDNEEKIVKTHHTPASLILIGNDGSRHAMIPGSLEAETAIKEVKQHLGITEEAPEKKEEEEVQKPESEDADKPAKPVKTSAKKGKGVVEEG